MFAGIILQGLKRITLANGLSTGQNPIHLENDSSDSPLGWASK